MNIDVASRIIDQENESRIRLYSTTEAQQGTSNSSRLNSSLRVSLSPRNVDLGTALTAYRNRTKSWKRKVVAILKKRRTMSSSSIPLYRVKGTHYECAHTIGALTRERIRHRIADDLVYLSPLFDFIRTEHGHKLHRDFIEAIRSMFPWYWDELRGMADGSEIPLDQLLVLNFLNETRTVFRLMDEEKKLAETNGQLGGETGERGCTTVLINRQDTNTLSLLHNEDHSTALYMTGYLVEFDIKSSSYDDGKRESPNEKFIAYCYAGAIPGNAFGANTHGFTFSLNGLYPNYVGHGRLPRQIVNRALLSVRNEDELDHLLQTSPVAYGFCVNGGFFRKQNGELGYLLNYEIGPNLNSDEKNYVSKCLVLNREQNQHQETDDLVIARNYLVHYNHYERLNNWVVEQKSLKSSHSRAQRGSELGEIFTVDDAIRLLGDRENEAFPIFRVPSKTDTNSVTLCTIHFDFRTLQLVVYHHNPKENREPTLIYNLVDLFVQEIRDK